MLGVRAVIAALGVVVLALGFMLVRQRITQAQPGSLVLIIRSKEKKSADNP